MAGQVVTFLFTDIAGSTRQWEADPESMRDALAAHDALLWDVITATGGQVFKHTGDGCAAAFADAADGVRAAVAAQRSLVAGGGGGLAVRMALHTGTAEGRDGDWFGPPLNRCARIVGVTHPRQILLSDVTARLVERAEVELLDLGEHELRDLAQPERLWQVCAPDLPRDFPAIGALRVRGRLPRPRTSLVGRDEAIRRTAALVEEAPLVTLTGIGGCGKTRLAIAVAHELAERFLDGAWFVDLAPIADPALVAHQIAAAVALPRSANPRADLGSYLSERHALIVLDNCEHLLDECADLVDELVEAAPGLRVLVTSREPLGVDGEQTSRVASLDPTGDGVLLFETRARAVRDDFRLDDQSRTVVGELCHALDGIPLAIELAAAQVGAFAPEQILGLLDQRLTVLSGGRRRGRQATLAAVMDWSYALLDEPTRRALRRAAVLPGSFGLDALAAVVDCDGNEATRLVRDLVRKSLLERDTTAGAARYRMLETVRLYGEQELAAEDDPRAARDRLGTWILTALRAAPPGSPMVELARRETDAIRAALGWAHANGRILDIGALVTLAGWGWTRSLNLDDVRPWLDLLEASDETLPADLRIGWRSLRAAVAMATGDGATMFEWSSAALALERGDHDEWYAFALLMHAIVLQYLDLDAARVELERGRGLAGNPLVDSAYEVFLALQPLLGDEPERAIAALEAAEDWSRARGERWQATVARVGRATALDLAGRPAEALEAASELLDEVGEGLDWIDELIVVMAVAIPTARLGDLAGACAHLRRMLDTCHRRYAHIPNAVGIPVVTAGVMLRLLGDDARAATVLSSACTTLLATRSEMAWATARHELRGLREHGVTPAAEPLAVAELVAITEEVAARA